MPIVKFYCSMCIKGCLNYPTAKLYILSYLLHCATSTRNNVWKEQVSYKGLEKRWKMISAENPRLASLYPSACQSPVSRAWRIGENGECLECFVSKIIKCFMNGACLRGNFYNCVCLKLYVAKNGVDLKLFGSKMVCVFDCAGLEWCGSIITCLESCVAEMVYGEKRCGSKMG